MAAHSPPIEIDIGPKRWITTFSANGEYLVSGGDGVQVWKVEYGKLKSLATMKAGSVQCLAVSKDGKWIAAGTTSGKVIVWDTKTYEQVWTFKKGMQGGINGVDFSPDSTRLVSASSKTAIVWSIAVGKQVHTLRHEGRVTAAKYSPQGDRIATATHRKSVRVWDSSTGRLLLDRNFIVIPEYNAGLLWFGNGHLLVLLDSTIRQFEASSGSVVSDLSVSDTGTSSCIALPKHGEFIAYTTKRSLTFWDASTHTRLGLIQHHQDIRSVALSADDQLVAIGGGGEKFTIKSLSPVTNSIPLSRLHTTFLEPEFRIDDPPLNAWKQDRLSDADALLTVAAYESRNSSHPVLAGRALVRARLRQWDVALEDAEMATHIQPSVIGYIAKSIAHVGKEEKEKAYEACDVAFERFHSSHGTFILLIKAIIMFMAGEQRDAISRVDNLIATVYLNSMCHVVQARAYMYLLLGDSQMRTRDYKSSIQSFEYARARMQHHTSQPLFVVSMISGWKFDNLDTTIRQRLCDALCAAGDFSLEQSGDAAVDARQYHEAISHYTTALSVNPLSQQGIFVKRSKAFLAAGSWKQALDDANKAITLDPSSPWGYEMKHAALHRARDYDNAVATIEEMLSKTAQPPGPNVEQYGDQYVSPSSTRATIRNIVQRTIRHFPRVLIDTTTGCLHNRTKLEPIFEALSIFKELVSSMTTRIDHVRIEGEVRLYFRYVMLSHRWEENEPLFQKVVPKGVYHLNQSPTHDKLRRFCEIARDAGFKWAWSDTCCINKLDPSQLQEAVVAMFKWYRSSSLTIVFLRGIRSSSQPGDLARSIWNTRGWTLQEYIASNVIHFYTEDWTPYLDLELLNHKELPEIIWEMKRATGVSARQLTELRPGLSSIREKLRLASTRQTTEVEDAAYSLLGIFSVTGISPVYGQEERALGNLLAHVLTGSGDVSILAWTGEPNRVNSCLPAYITVFHGPATSHLPSPIPDTEMGIITTASHASSFDLDVALRLYDRLNELSAPLFAASRMKLPCIAFQLPALSRTRSGRIYTYCVDTDAFGMVEIKTRQDLSWMNSLYLVHPWLGTVLEQDGSHIIVEEDPMPPRSPNTDDSEEVDDSSSPTELETPPQPARARIVPMDRETRARRLVANLRQPFGALLVAQALAGRMVDYRRVAADSLITVQFQENVSLANILDNVRTLDVL